MGILLPFIIFHNSLFFLSLLNLQFSLNHVLFKNVFSKIKFNLKILYTWFKCIFNLLFFFLNSFNNIPLFFHHSTLFFNIISILFSLLLLFLSLFLSFSHLVS